MGCPYEHVSQKESGTPEVINPANMMPVDLDQEDQQSTQLSTVRAKSTILKQNSEETWEYPSPKQFYNAMKRKNKNPETGLMDVVVDIHNAVNEWSWQKILDRERALYPACQDLSLIRFVGRPQEESVQVKVDKWVRPHLLLFDRHDWFVDRCGTEVRYMIDYYHDEKDSSDVQVKINARPAAFDSFLNFWDRVRYLWTGAPSSAD